MIGDWNQDKWTRCGSLCGRIQFSTSRDNRCNHQRIICTDIFSRHAHFARPCFCRSCKRIEVMAWKQLLNILHARSAHWTTHRQRMESLEKRRLKNCARSISFPELRMKNCWGGNPSPYHGWWKNENLALTKKGEIGIKTRRNRWTTWKRLIPSWIRTNIVLIWSLFTYRLLRRCDSFDFLIFDYSRVIIWNEWKFYYYYYYTIAYRIFQIFKYRWNGMN